MYQFPPGFNKRVFIGVGVAAVCAVLFGAMVFGGRPTAQEEANRQVLKERKLWEQIHRK